MYWDVTNPLSLGLIPLYPYLAPIALELWKVVRASLGVAYISLVVVADRGLRGPTPASKALRGSQSALRAVKSLEAHTATYIWM